MQTFLFIKNILLEVNQISSVTHPLVLAPNWAITNAPMDS